MTELLKIMGVAIVTSVAAILLKSTKPELSFAVTVTGVIVILLFIVDAMRELTSVFYVIAEITGVENGLLKLLLKIVGVGYITEFGTGVLQDFGSSAIADKVALGGKLMIVLLALPIMRGLLQLVANFLQLV